MLSFLDYWRQEAQGLYRQVPESDDVSDREKHDSFPSISTQYIVLKIYQVAPFLLLLNLVIAALWTVQGISHVFRRPRAFAPKRK